MFRKTYKKNIAFPSLEIQSQKDKKDNKEREREREIFISFYISLSYSNYHVIM